MATSVSLTILPTTASLLHPIPTSISNDFPLTNASGGDNGSRNVSYFFGFLVAIIAFLVFFIGCSIGARRGLLRRRRFDVETGNARFPGAAFGRVAGHMSPPKEPVLWETSFEKGGSRWESIMPLSVAPASEGEDDAPPSYMPLSMPMPNWLRPRERMPSSSMLRWWMPSLPRMTRRAPPETAVSPGVPMNTISQTASPHSSPLSSIPDPSPTPMSPIKNPTDNSSMTPSDYQVVVMIAMPSQYPPKDGSLGDLQFGVTKLPVSSESL